MEKAYPGVFKIWFKYKIVIKCIIMYGIIIMYVKPRGKLKTIKHKIYQ